MKFFSVKNLKTGTNCLNSGHRDSIPKTDNVPAKLGQLECLNYLPNVNISTAQEPQQSDINVTKAQLQSLENKLLGKILVFKSFHGRNT